MAHRKQSLIEDLIEITRKLPLVGGRRARDLHLSWIAWRSDKRGAAVMRPGKIGEIASQPLVRLLAPALEQAA